MAEPYIDTPQDDDDQLRFDSWRQELYAEARRARENAETLPVPFHPMCRWLIVPIPGILETTERAMLSDILGVPYDWAYEYVEVRIKQLKEEPADAP